MNRPALFHRLPVARQGATLTPVARQGATLTPLARQGATLTEVLMSLLIMGLGITSVFTLFPMTILRSVKSTNLTHASLLADTARDFYVYRKETLTRPPARTYNAATSYYSHGKDYLMTQGPGVVPDVQIPEPFVGTYVVDPLGGVNATDFGRAPGKYGEVLRVANQLPNPTTMPGVSTVLYTSHDSWVTALEEVPVTVSNGGTAPNTYTQFTFISDIDLNSTVNTSSRVLVTSLDNRQSFTAGLNATPVPAAKTLRLDRTLPRSLYDTNPPPTNNVGLVRIQSFERRYSHLMTMHRDELGQTRGQLVVFFRREFGDSELAYDVAPNTSTNRLVIDKRLRKITVDLNHRVVYGGATDGIIGKVPKGGDYILGTWHAKPSSSGAPYFVVHARWYRVVGVSALGGNQYTLTLDRGWEGLTDAGNEPRIMLPNGVISVFDL